MGQRGRKTFRGQKTSSAMFSGARKFGSNKKAARFFSSKFSTLLSAARALLHAARSGVSSAHFLMQSRVPRRYIYACKDGAGHDVPRAV
jgi:hypothetical protein